ncbi:LOW QUALITY PROTEIN: hypothetical protein Bca101_026470 [Brassica carinata]
MSKSLNLKRKRPIEDDYGQTPAKGSNQGKAEASKRYRAILTWMSKTATAKKHSTEVDRNSISKKIALLDEMLDMTGMFNIQADKADSEPNSIVRRRSCRLSMSLSLTGTSLARAGFGLSLEWRMSLSGL